MSNKKEQEAKVKLAIAFYAATQIQIELIDELKGTSLYSQKFKNLGNSIQKEGERRMDFLYKQLDKEGEAEKVFNETVKMTEVLLKAVRNGNMDVMIELLDSYNKGNITAVDESGNSTVLKA